MLQKCVDSLTVLFFPILLKKNVEGFLKPLETGVGSTLLCSVHTARSFLAGVRRTVEVPLNEAIMICGHVCASGSLSGRPGTEIYMSDLVQR